MIININQNKVSFGDKYKIFTDNEPTHRASSRLFSWMPVFNLFENGSDQPVLTIRKRFSILKAKYNIILPDGLTLEFRTVAFGKGHFGCHHNTDRYDIYKHTGRKCSIYCNDRQIAWWDKKAVTWFNGDNYTITADRRCNKNLVIAFCLIIDNYSSNEKSTLNIDVGRIGPTAKKFDSDWAPAD